MKVNLLRDDAYQVVGVAWKVLGRVGHFLWADGDTSATDSDCVCGEKVCDCGCDCVE